MKESNISDEIWKPSTRFSDYEISNKGRVRRISTGNILTPWSMKGKATVRYPMVKIKQVNRYVHRLVAETFIPNPDNLPQVNHINGDKSDNRVENLEWVDASYNQIHAIKEGLHKKIAGCCHGRRAVIVYDVINNSIHRCDSVQEAGRFTGVDPRVISRVASGQRRNRNPRFRFEYADELDE